MTIEDRDKNIQTGISVTEARKSKSSITFYFMSINYKFGGK